MLAMFTHLTVFDEGHYYPADPKMLEFMIEHKHDDFLQQLEAAFAADYKLSLFSEWASHASVKHPLLSRGAQAHLFIAISNWLNRQHGSDIKAYGGYCHGITTALYAAGSLSLEGYLTKIRTPLERYLRDLNRTVVEHDPCSGLFDFSNVMLDSDQVTAVVREFSSDIHIKDVRGNGVFELLGNKQIIASFIEMIQSVYGSAVLVGRLLPDTAAHTSIVNVEKYRESFMGLGLKSVPYPIFSSTGRACAANSDPDELNQLYVDTVLNPFRMKDCVEIISGWEDLVYIVGSEATTNFVFAGFGEDRPEVKVITADMLA